MRKPVIAGNWKMNNTIAAATSLINELKPLVADAEAEVVICVPYTAYSRNEYSRWRRERGLGG